MKKPVLYILAAMLLITAGCAVNEGPEATETATHSYALENAKGLIGLSLSEDSAFNSDFSAEFKRLSEESGYNVDIRTANGGVHKQISDILELVAVPVNAIVIDPVDIDELNTAMDECEGSNIPVFNVIIQINEIVKMLIAPDFKKMAGMAATEAEKYLQNGDGLKGRVLMLQGNYDSFLMQLLHDGFTEVLNKSDGLNIDAAYCDFNETKAYLKTKEALTENKPDVIYSQSEKMAKGALKAMEETGVNVKLITIGAGEDIIKAITDGKIAAAIYFGPVELAQKTALYAQKYLENPAEKLPQYTAIRIAKADADNAAALIPSGKRHADLPAG